MAATSSASLQPRFGAITVPVPLPSPMSSDGHASSSITTATSLRSDAESHLLSPADPDYASSVLQRGTLVSVGSQSQQSVSRLNSPAHSASALAAHSLSPVASHSGMHCALPSQTHKDTDTLPSDLPLLHAASSGGTAYSGHSLTGNYTNNAPSPSSIALSGVSGVSSGSGEGLSLRSQSGVNATLADKSVDQATVGTTGAATTTASANVVRSRHSHSMVSSSPLVESPNSAEAIGAEPHRDPAVTTGDQHSNPALARLQSYDDRERLLAHHLSLTSVQLEAAGALQHSNSNLAPSASLLTVPSVDRVGSIPIVSSVAPKAEAATVISPTDVVVADTEPVPSDADSQPSATVNARRYSVKIDRVDDTQPVLPLASAAAGANPAPSAISTVEAIAATETQDTTELVEPAAPLPHTGSISVSNSNYAPGSGKSALDMAQLSAPRLALRTASPITAGTPSLTVPGATSTAQSLPLPADASNQFPNAPRARSDPVTRSEKPVARPVRLVRSRSGDDLLKELYEPVLRSAAVFSPAVLSSGQNSARRSPHDGPRSNGDRDGLPSSGSLALTRAATEPPKAKMVPMSVTDNELLQQQQQQRPSEQTLYCECPIPLSLSSPTFKSDGQLSAADVKAGV